MKEDLPKCFRCGREMNEFIYIAATVFKDPEGQKIIQTWCADICANCEKEVQEFIGKTIQVRY